MEKPMLVPNSEYIIVQIDDLKSLVPGKTFVGKVYAVGQPNYAPQPVAGDGTNFSFARQPESFPITKGDQVIVGSFLDTIEENGVTYTISFKTEVFAVIKNEEEELNLFNMEMNQEIPQFLKG